MSRPRKSPVRDSATLLTVSLALCLGAAAEVRAAPSVLRATTADTPERVVLNARQRHALATLVAGLTDAARQLHQAPQAHAAILAPRTLTPDTFEPAATHRPPDAPRALPTPPLREALRNLPPPTVR